MSQVTEVERPDAGAPPAGRPGRIRALLPWLVTLVAVAMAVWSTLQWQSLAAREERREDVQAAASGFLVALTNWDATDGLDDTRAALKQAGTGDFLDEVDNLFGDQFGDDLEQAGAVSTGDVRDVFVQCISGSDPQDGTAPAEDVGSATVTCSLPDQAIVFGVVSQSIEFAVTGAGPTTVARSARITLRRVDGTWKVSGVELVDPGLAAAGAAPSDGEDQP